ncbi:hypothetical protein FRAHR75_230029 [Frankia sp. Hr75.2]|nr:hypothetical protein FRAHR75_230029 [Frankia sp. Hr75.2]SQD97116.1 hypothetical protein FMEAI12_3940034 [Parafrankia sp. Ea1.12]
MTQWRDRTTELRFRGSTEPRLGGWAAPRNRGGSAARLPREGMAEPRARGVDASHQRVM